MQSLNCCLKVKRKEMTETVDKSECGEWVLSTAYDTVTIRSAS